MVRRAGAPVSYAPGNSVGVCEDIVSLAELGRRPGPHRLLLAPSYGGPPQLPLFNEAALPEEIVRQHHGWQPPPAVAVYGLPAHELGGGGLLHRDGKLFLANDVMPEYFKAFVGEAGHRLERFWTGGMFDPGGSVLEVDGPVAVPLHPNLVYGHFLLEMLPRLYLLSRLRRMGAAFPVAVPEHLPGWAERMLALYVDPAELIRYDMETTRLRAACFIVPSMLHVDHHFHPEFNLMAEELRERLLPTAPPSPHSRIWLSRRGHEGLHGMENEDEVEATVAALDFAIVNPTALGFAEQVALMDGAALIAGGFGSAMHNSLFARRGAKVFCVNCVNWYQSSIARLRGQKLAYMPPADGRFRDWRVQGTAAARYSVDCKALREQLWRFEAWQGE